MNYLIYGLGKSGIASANFLSNKYNVLATDDSENSIKNAQQYLNKEITLKNSNEIDYSTINKVIFAPGIPLYYPQQHKILDLKSKYGFELICDIEEFYNLNKENNFIGITGTNGKSTLSALTHHIFTNLNIKNEIGGNFGIPVFDINFTKDTTLIFECSSFQLDLVKNLKFDISCLLNITPDHLDRHKNMQNYCTSKQKIFNNQKTNDYAVINIDNANCQKIQQNLNNQNIISFSIRDKKNSSLNYINNLISIKTNFHNEEIEFSHKYLKGNHNKENIIAAIAITIIFLHKNKIEINLKKILEIISNFKGLKHRQEFIRNIGKINFINDSKATNSESTKTALQAFDNVFLILGGKQKDNLEAIIDDLKNVKKIYLIGESQENFAQILTKNSIAFEKNKELNIALQKSFSDAQNNNDLDYINILFSPACSSFDQFQNFEQRGNNYCKLVNDI